jgi:glutamate-1-semialdehyde 2,1-aminomutase
MQFKNRISRDKSELLFNEAKNMFPGGVNSPVRAFKSVSGPPLFIKHGQGCRIIDEDNNEYIDFCNSWGPLILGHNNEKVKASIIEALDHGTSFGTPTAYGNKIGKLILENHKYLERIRFVCSGTEAVMSAIRLARGYTKKNKIVKFEGCYHGHVDSLMVKAGSGLITFGESTSAGIPQSFANETIVLKLNDYESLSHTLKEYGHDIAAVIIEPVPANNGLLLQDKEFLSFIIDECKKYDVLSIFDEVISGFRVSFGGAAEYYNLQPDLLTFGKIIGGGMPVGMYGGKAEIMKMIAPEGPVYQAGTLSANPVTLAAGIAALELLLSNDFYRNMENKTSYFVNKIETHITENGYDAGIINIGSIFWIKFSKERIISSDQINPSGMDRFKILHHELLQEGIYLGPSGYEVGFVSAAHSIADLDIAAVKINQALDMAFAN